MKNLLFIALIFLTLFTFGQEQLITDINDLPDKLKNAKPGDEFVIADGIYSTNLKLEANGSAIDSIQIRPQSEGGVIFRNQIVLKGSYIRLEGFVFESSNSIDNSVKLNATIKCSYLRNSRIVGNSFDQVGRTDRHTYDAAVLIENSDHVKIDGNNWDNTRANCIYIVPPSNNISIQNNVFNYTPVADINRWEMIKINNNIERSLSESFVIIKNNAFISYYGDEAEVISMKSSRNFVIDNLFYKCSGDVMFRQGHTNTVSGNIFYQSKGVRVSGQNHIISDNYFMKSTKSPLRIMNGDSAPVDPVYKPVENLVVVSNYFESLDYPSLTIGSGPSTYTVPPANVTIANNLFKTTASQEVTDWRRTKKFELNFLNDITSDSTEISLDSLIYMKRIPLPDSLRAKVR